jgi:hypothetical protein
VVNYFPLFGFTGNFSKVIHKVRHRKQPLPASWAAWRNNSVTALRYRWRLIHEGVEGVAANLGLECPQ